MDERSENVKWRLFAIDESGQALVITALCMAVLISALALAVDAGLLRYQKRRVQNAADAAALAGALEISTCGSTANCIILRTAAQDALKENGFATSTLLTDCAKASVTTVQLTINNPPCALASDPNHGSTSAVEIIVSSPVTTAFARIFGLKTVVVSARAEAASQPNRACVYALDPSASGSLILDSATTVSADCAMYVESTATDALQCTSAELDAPSVSIVGGMQQSSCTFQNALGTGTKKPYPADPLASLPKPSTPACGTSTSSPYHGSSAPVSITDTATVYPDHAYCGGITISSTANVTFMPGTYVLIATGNEQWGLRLCVQSTVTGNGVTFYNAGTGAIDLYNVSTGTGGVTLTAPTSGTYAGVLFFQDSSNSTAANLLGNPQWNTVLEGAYYFPSATVTDNYSGTVRYNFLIAKDIEFANLSTTGAGNSFFTSNYSTLSSGSPLGGSSASVVQ